MDVAIYKQAIEANADAIICSNESEFITYWNPAAERMFGYSQKEILGQPISQLTAEEFRGTYTSGMKDFFRTGKSAICGNIIEALGFQKTVSVVSV